MQAAKRCTCHRNNLSSSAKPRSGCSWGSRKSFSFDNLSSQIIAPYSFLDLLDPRRRPLRGLVEDDIFLVIQPSSLLIQCAKSVVHHLQCILQSAVYASVTICHPQQSRAAAAAGDPGNLSASTIFHLRL